MVPRSDMPALSLDMDPYNGALCREGWKLSLQLSVGTEVFPTEPPRQDFQRATRFKGLCIQEQEDAALYHVDR